MVDTLEAGHISDDLFKGDVSLNRLGAKKPRKPRAKKTESEEISEKSEKPKREEESAVATTTADTVAKPAKEPKVKRVADEDADANGKRKRVEPTEETGNGT